MYYRDINLRRNTNTKNIIYLYDYWNKSQGRLNSEIMNFAKEYIENNPKPDNMELIILCELNLDTGISNILSGQYINIQ
jgi:hypothetical protein